MALRSSAQGHRLDFAGPYPASSRPLSVCGFVRVIENANTWATLVGLGQDADINLTQLGVNTGNTSNLQLVCYQVTPTWNEILETVNTGLSTGQDFFWGISFPSGTAKPTFFWRALSTPTLSTSTPGGTAGTWTFTPSRLSLNYLSGLLAGEWANARQSGVRLWNRTMTAGEMLSESLSLHARNRQGLVLDAPCIRDGRDLSQFGAGRVGTITGMTVEPGPPVGWGSSIIAPPLYAPVLVMGSLAATESGSDTAAFSGTVVSVATGSLAATESGSDTAALAGVVLVEGALAATESGSDVAAIEGTALIVSTGTLDATESGSDTAEIVGATLAQGTLAATESGADAAAITGLALVSGTLDATEAGSDTAVIAAVALVQGSLDATESGSDTAAIEGSLAVISTGSLAATESGADTAEIAGVALVSGALAATEAANDSAAVSGVVLVTGALDATETGSDTAAFASSTPVTTAYPGPAGRATKGKRRRVIIGERLYNVLERDIPALLEAELLDRAPPVTAEVIEGPKPPRKRAKKAPQPVKTVEQVRETVQQIKRRIEPDDAWLAQALEAVAFRVLERLQDEEDSLMLLLAA